jgi:hypothetical protein
MANCSSTLLRSMVCRTDKEIAAGDYGSAPAGQDRLVIGHQSLGQAPPRPAVGFIGRLPFLTSRPDAF